MDHPTAIYSARQVRALDRHEIEQRGVPGYTLMTRAAAGALARLRTHWPQARRIAVVCGGGNNGGDGYVLARLARAAGLEAFVLAATPADTLTGDARRAQQDWSAAGGTSRDFTPAALAGADVVVDGLLGIGLEGAPRAATLAVIEAINAAALPVLALDLPSGLNADSGAVHGAAIRAQLTVSFVGLKAGTFLGAGPDHSGVVLLEDLGVVPPVSVEFSPLMRRIDLSELATALPPRARDAHKGTSGRVLVVGGGPGMPGAARLAGEAALRVGAGLVTVAGAPDNLLAVTATRPELIYLAAPAPGLEAAMRGADAVAIGPGLGTGEWGARLWAEFLRIAPARAVLDADALNLLARAPAKLSAEWVLTPHPGEAARLLGSDTAAVQADRLGAVRELHSRYGAVVVLKGAGTLVAGGAESSPYLCDRGNPGMATAGMGDVLTGVIAGLLPTNDSARAARLGVLVHALAGDAAARAGQRGLIASDVIAALRAQVNP